MQKFIILSTQRTGSAFLEQCLNSHDEIHCAGEILLGYGGLYGKMPPSILIRYRRLRTLWQAVASGAILKPVSCIESNWGAASREKASGFRLMYNQLSRDPRVSCYMKKRQDIKIIHLKRENLLKQYVSLKLMHDQVKYGRYSAHVEKPSEPVKISVNFSQAYEHICKALAEQKKYDMFFNGFEKIDIKYEDMVDDGGISPEISRRLTDYLGVDDKPLKTQQRKMNPSRLSEFVVNYDELMSGFIGTDFESMLDAV